MVSVQTLVLNFLLKEPHMLLLLREEEYDDDEDDEEELLEEDGEEVVRCTKNRGFNFCSQTVPGPCIVATQSDSSPNKTFARPVLRVTARSAPIVKATKENGRMRSDSLARSSLRMGPD